MLSPGRTVCQFRAPRSAASASARRARSASALPDGTFNSYACARTGVVQRRSSGLSCWMTSTGVDVHSAMRRKSTGPATVTLSTVDADLGSGTVKPVLSRVSGDDDCGQDHRHVFPRLTRQVAWVGRQRPEVVAAVALHRTLHAAGPAVVRRQRQVPVAVEHPAERLEVLCRGPRGLVGIGPLVHVPVVLQAVFARRRAHELPDALGACPRQRVGLECAFNQRHVRQIQRQTLGPKHALDHRQVVAAAIEPFLDEPPKPALEQLDVVEHPGVERNGDVVRCQREVGLNRRGQRRRGRFLGGRRQVEQRVDGRRFARLLRIAVAVGERGDFQRADTVDEPVELLTEPGFGSRATRRGQQDVDGAIELHAGAVEVSDLELALARKIVFL